MKQCTKCGKIKDEYRFSKDSQKKCGLRPSCIDCKNDYLRDYNKRNPEKVKNRKLKERYGITINQYNQMLEQQNEKCAICKKHKKDLKEDLCVDHNHKTNQVRGLLCRKCNYGIGFLNESFEIITNAMSYLEKWNINNGN